MINKRKNIFRWALAFLMISAGIAHFANPKFFIQLIQDFLPYANWLVYTTGFLEILFGFGLLIKKYQRLFGILTVHLLILYIPVHYHLATTTIKIEGITEITWIQWVRFGLQFVLIFWALWCTKKETPKETRTFKPGSSSIASKQ